jgi:hypothetical protein
MSCHYHCQLKAVEVSKCSEHTPLFLPRIPLFNKYSLLLNIECEIVKNEEETFACKAVPLRSCRRQGYKESRSYSFRTYSILLIYHTVSILTSRPYFSEKCNIVPSEDGSEGPKHVAIFFLKWGGSNKCPRVDACLRAPWVPEAHRAGVSAAAVSVNLVAFF